MSGSNPIAETLAVPDMALAGMPITLTLKGGKSEFKAGVSSRSRVVVDYDAPSLDQEKSFEIDLYLDSGACVDVFHLLTGNEREVLSVNVRYHLKKHSSLNVWTCVAGGGSASFVQEVRFEEENAFASLRGLSILSGHSKVTHRVLADHAKAHCISRQFFKTIASGEATSGFESLVAVAKDAVKTDSKQLNKNLVLSGRARCQSRPELRIAADDVACVHGSATGEIDPAQLFYLRSRGLSKEAARSVMIEGFAEEVLNDVTYEPVKKRLQLLVQKRTSELSKAAA